MTNNVRCFSMLKVTPVTKSIFDIVHFCLTVWIISYVDSYRNTDSHVTD